MSSSNVSLALKEKKSAEAALKTSFFGNWKPDIDSAAHHFEKAAQLFKVSKSYKESRECYLEAAKYFEQARVLFSAAKCYQALAMVCKEQNEFNKTLEYIRLAGDLYTQNGTTPSAVICYTKGAEHIAAALPGDAAELYLMSAELERDCEHPQDAIKHLLSAKRIFGKNAMYKECIRAVLIARDLYGELDNFPQIQKCNLTLVILHLALGDTVAAKNSIQGDVSGIADELVEAVESGDEESLEKLSKHNDVIYLDAEIARIAKYLTVDGASMPLSKTSQKTTISTQEAFKSSSNSGKSSNKSMRDELFSRSNKENRDELFGRSPKPVPSHSEPVSIVKNDEPVAPTTDSSNPFGGDGDDDELDLC